MSTQYDLRRRGFLASFVLPLIATALLAAVQPCQAGDLSGSWAGYWVSCTSGHKGPLRATFCKTDETHYCVHFRGRFFKVVPFHYAVTLAVTGQEGDRFILSGESYLGLLFGTFHYRAEATDAEFVATYSSCRDQGKFVMSRCCGRVFCSP